MPVTNGREWDDSADAALAALYAGQGLGRTEVAGIMGRTEAAISNRVWRLKITERAGVQMRKCLGGCERMFPSSWIGHRQCPSCTVINAGMMECA